MKYILLIISLLVVCALGVYLIAQQVYAPELPFDEPEVVVDADPADEEAEDSWPDSQVVTHPNITVFSPQPGELIQSPLTIQGEARGMWYFEASFPIVVVDWNGLIVGEGYAQADGEWMTEEFVPFTAVVEFTTPTYGERGAIILQRDNPSGLPENDAAIEIPIRFTE